MRIFAFRRFGLRCVGVGSLETKPDSCNVVSFDRPRDTNGFRLTPSGNFKIVKNLGVIDPQEGNVAPGHLAA